MKGSAFRSFVGAALVSAAALTAGGATARGDDAVPALPSAPGSAASPSVDPTPLGTLATPPAATVEPATPAPIAPAPQAAEVDPVPPELGKAVNRLLQGAAKSNPLGAGNWNSARQAIRAFYEGHAFAPVWIDAHGLTPSGRNLAARLAHANADGLDLSAFSLPSPTFAESDPQRLAEADLTLSAAAVVYALQASGARIKPTSISPYVTARPTIADAAVTLNALVGDPDPGAALQALNPPQKGYRDLREELAQLLETTPAAEEPIAPGPILKIGMVDPRVPLIRAKLGLGSTADGLQAVYDARIASAVAAFQRSRGLAANGAWTEATSEALTGDPQIRREGAIRANMEMWRWQPRDMGEERIEVNVADYTLHLMRGEDEIHRARVIVGKPDTPTPVFSNSVKYILVNPIWRVPDSIIDKEMKPKLAKDPDWLTNHGYKVTQSGDRMVVEQPPGEANALGRILFMFPNEHSVYLHDTPTRGLFATARRALSHGCVRVEQPMHLAEILLGGAAHGWSERRVESMLGTNERAIFLPAPVPIHLEYFTEFVDETGALREREDIYGLTAKVAATLSALRQD